MNDIDIANELLKIFAGVDKPLPRRNDDSIAFELVHFLHKLAKMENLSTPQLDLFCSGKYPLFNLNRHVNLILMDLHDTAENGSGLELSAYSMDEYRELCRNIFPAIILDVFPVPSNQIDCYQNIFAAWHLSIGNDVHEEIWHGSGNLRLAGRIIRDYMTLGIHNWPESSAVWFFKTWNAFLLTRKWSDEITKLKTDNQRLTRYTHSLEFVNLTQINELTTLRKALSSRYIILSAASEAIMKSYWGGNKDVATSANTLHKRIKSHCKDLTFIPGKQGAKYYALNDIASICQADDDLQMDESRILCILIQASVAEEDIPPPMTEKRLTD